jgi:hypothetical protein
VRAPGNYNPGGTRQRDCASSTLCCCQRPDLLLPILLLASALAWCTPGMQRGSQQTPPRSPRRRPRRDPGARSPSVPPAVTVEEQRSTAGQTEHTPEPEVDVHAGYTGDSMGDHRTATPPRGQSQRESEVYSPSLCSSDGGSRTPYSSPRRQRSGDSLMHEHRLLDTALSRAAVAVSDREKRWSRARQDALVEELRRELSCTNWTLSALLRLAGETAGVDPCKLTSAMDTHNPTKAIIEIIVHARCFSGSWAAQDSLLLLRWARLWQRWDPNYRQPLAGDQAVHKKIISRSVRGFLEEHRPEALVAVLAIILADARQQRRRTQLLGASSSRTQELLCARCERCARCARHTSVHAAKDTEQWWRMEARFLEQLWCRGMSEDQFDVLRYIKHITQEMVFNDFVLPVISMYLDSAEFAKYLVYWLAKDGNNPLLRDKKEVMTIDLALFKCASKVCTQSICEKNGDVIRKHDTHGFTWLERKAKEEMDNRKSERTPHPQPQPQPQPAMEPEPETELEPQISPWGRKDLDMGVRPSADRRTQIETSTSSSMQRLKSKKESKDSVESMTTQIKKIASQIDHSIEDTIRMLVNCTSSHGGWVQTSAEHGNGHAPQRTHALLKGMANNDSVLVVSDIYDLGDTVYFYDEEADTVIPSEQAGDSCRKVHPCHDIRYRYGTINGVTKGRDTEYVMINKHVETLEEVQNIVMQAFNPNWQKQQLNQEIDPKLPDSKTFTFPPKLLLSVQSTDDFPPDDDTRGSPRRSFSDPVSRPEPVAPSEAVAAAAAPEPEQDLKADDRVLTQDRIWKAFVQELFTKAREPALSYEPFFHHRLPKTNEEYKELVNAQHKDIFKRRPDLAACTHLILFEKGSPFAKPPGSGHTLMERLQREKAVRRVIAMIHGNDTDLTRVLRQLEDPKRNPHLTVMPLIGAAGASHFLGRAAELYNYSDQAALARLAIANLPLGMVAGHEVSGGIQQSTLNHLRSVVSKDLCRQRIYPLDITAQPDQDYLNQLMTNSLWGIDHKGFDEMLGKYWGVIRELHKLYRARMAEAYCNYAAVFILSLAIVVLGVLDATETADASQNITDAVENDIEDDADYQYIFHSDYHTWLIILPAVTGFLVGVQTLRHAVQDAATLSHCSGTIQGEIYKLRTNSGEYSKMRNSDSDIYKYSDSDMKKKIFGDRCENARKASSNIMPAFPSYSQMGWCTRLLCACCGWRSRSCPLSCGRGERWKSTMTEAEKAAAAIKYARRWGLLFQPGRQSGIAEFKLDRFPYQSSYSDACLAVASSSGRPEYSDSSIGTLRALRHIRSRPRLVWDSLMIIAAVLLFCLDLLSWYDSECGGPMFWLVMATFSADMLLNVVSIGQLHDHPHVLDPQPLRENAMAYLLSPWFFLDLVALFPWCAVLDVDEDSNSTAHSAKVVRVLRILRLLRLLRTSKHVTRVQNNLVSRRRAGAGGDDGLSRMSGPDYVKLRLVPLRSRYESNMAWGTATCQILQHGSAAVALTGSILGSLNQGRWVVITSFVASAMLGLMTFFKLHTILDATNQAYESCQRISLRFSRFEGNPQWENDPEHVHSLVTRTEEAFVMETSAWAVALANDDKERAIDANGGGDMKRRGSARLGEQA